MTASGDTKTIHGVHALLQITNPSGLAQPLGVPDNGSHHSLCMQTLLWRMGLVSKMASTSKRHDDLK